MLGRRGSEAIARDVVEDGLLESGRAAAIAKLVDQVASDVLGAQQVAACAFGEHGLVVVHHSDVFVAIDVVQIAFVDD